MRWSEATLALARPRSTWLRKLSERPARSATARSVAGGACGSSAAARPSPASSSGRTSSRLGNHQRFLKWCQAPFDRARVRIESCLRGTRRGDDRADKDRANPRRAGTVRCARRLALAARRRSGGGRPDPRTSTARSTSTSQAASAARTPATARRRPSRRCTSRSTATSTSASWSARTSPTSTSAAGWPSSRRARGESSARSSSTRVPRRSRTPSRSRAPRPAGPRWSSSTTRSTVGRS